MDEQTKKAIGEYLKQLLELVKSGVDFTVEQIPLVIKEKLAYDLVINALFAGFGVLLLLTAVFFLKRTYAIGHLPNERGSWPDDKCVKFWLTGLVPGFASTLLGCTTFFGSLPIVLKIYLAPRLYIIEWLRGML